MSGRSPGPGSDHLGRAIDGHGALGDQLLGQLHHALVIGISLVKLQQGEFRVVLDRHAFVAELAADLVDPLKAADDQALEIELRSNAQEQVDVQRIVVGDERPGRRAAGDDVQDRRLDLDEIQAVQLAAQGADDQAALLEGILDLRIDDQVEIALAIAGVRVLEAVVLFRQRPQRLGQQRVAAGS